MSTWIRLLSLKVTLCSLICLSFASIGFAKNYEARISSYQNDLHLVRFKLDENTGKLILDFDLETTNCVGTNCQQSYNSVGSLARTQKNGEEIITDVALRFPLSGQPIESICCTKHKKKVVFSRKCSTISSGLVGTGSIGIDPITGSLDSNLLNLEAGMREGIKKGKLNLDTCRPFGPIKKVISTKPDEFQCGVQNNSSDSTAIITRNPLEGFRLDYAYNNNLSLVNKVKLDLANLPNLDIRAASHTSPQALLPQGIAATSTLLLYRVFKVQGGTTQTAVFLQTFQLLNGQLALLGKPKIIAPFTTNPQSGLETFQSVSLAPDGRFALYTSYSSECKKEIVKLQRLNPNTGSKIGAPQVLKGCSSFANSVTGAYGLDVITVPD